MIKRYYKPRVVETYSINGYLEGPIFGYGRMGAGKSVSLKSLIEGFHDNYGYKIWDLYGGSRHEGIFWTLPSLDLSYWQKIDSLGRFDEEGPKQYKVNLLYPYFESKMPKWLPEKKNEKGEIIVKSKIFTIPFKDINLDDVSVVIGNPSESSKYCFNELQNNSTKKDNSGNLIEKSRKIKGMQNTPAFKNFITPLCREKFIMDNYCDYNIDLQSEGRDTKTITVLCLEFVPKAFHIFIIDYISRKLCDLIDKNKISKKNITFIREAANFFKATDDSILPDNYKIFRTHFTDYIRMGRRGNYACLDCQSPSETRGLVEGSQDYLLMFRMTSWRDKAEVCDELIRERRMSRSQSADLAFLDKGQAYIAESGRNVRKVQIILPRSAYWKKEYGNFYANMWEKYGGNKKNIEEIKDYINKRYDEKAEEASKYDEEIKISNKTEQTDEIKITQEPMQVPIQVSRKPSYLDWFNKGDKRV